LQVVAVVEHQLDLLHSPVVVVVQVD